MTTSSPTQLAVAGGSPVRDPKQKPWPNWPPSSDAEWRDEIEPALRAVYESHDEGLGGQQQIRFADSFAKACQTEHACMVAHGTDAISAALVAALDLDGYGYGGEVIVPNYTYIATASAAIHMNCSVAFVDVDPATFTLCPKAFEAAIRPGQTRAVIPVHVAGQPCDMDAINAIAKKHDIVVLEDCAQAHAALYRGKPVGGLGHAGCFSFQSSKNLCSGEGGVVTTDDLELHNRTVGLMNAGRLPAGERWKYARVGWNMRPSEYLAAMLSIRLKHLESQSDLRHRNALKLSEMLGQVPGITPPALGEWTTRHAWHLYPMLIDTEAFGGHSREEVVEAVVAEGIPATAGYTMLLSDSHGLQQLATDHDNCVRTEPCPVTADICSRSIWLYQYMLLGNDADMADIAEAFAKVQRAFAQ